MKYIYYLTTGEKVEIIATKPLSLDFLQLLVAGRIEGQVLSDGTYIFFNEEGLLDHLPVNPFFEEDNPLVSHLRTEGGIKGNVIQGKLENSDFVGL